MSAQMPRLMMLFALGYATLRSRRNAHRRHEIASSFRPGGSLTICATPISYCSRSAIRPISFARTSGARPVTLAQLSAGMSEPMDMDHGLMLEIAPKSDSLRAGSRTWASRTLRVVVYFANDRVSPTTRVLYTLVYAGLGHSSALLDGGLPVWQSEGKRVDRGPPLSIHRGALTTNAQSSLVVDAAWVQAHAGRHGIALLDARMTPFL